MNCVRVFVKGRLCGNSEGWLQLARLSERARTRCWSHCKPGTLTFFSTFQNRETRPLGAWMSDCKNHVSTSGSKEKFTVCVEGNIASGKTSLLEYFKDQPDTEVTMEPVDKWRNVQGHNTLGLMYDDPTRWALTLQTYVQLTMLDRHVTPQTKPVKLMERSILSAKYCFVENLHKSGKMPDVEYIVLTEWFDWIMKHHNINIDLIVYLQTDPEVVYHRIKTRCRHEETAIPLDYLTALHDLHEDWLIKKAPQFRVPAPVMVLDANLDFPDLKKVYEERKAEIMCGYV